mgnify:FL=1
MSIAELHGKLTPNEESAEDLLTSELFWTFELLGYDWLRPWLATGRGLGPAANPSCGGTELDLLLPAGPLREPPKIIFWPWIKPTMHEVDGCEPDILIKLDDFLLVVKLGPLRGQLSF